MYNLPSEQVLCSLDYELSDHELQVCQQIANRVNNSVKDIPMFVNEGISAVEHARFVCLCVIKWFMEKFSRDDGNKFILPVPVPDNEIILLLLTKHIETFELILYFHIMYNISFSGLFTEYWGPVRYHSVCNCLKRGDVLLPLIVSQDSVFQDVLDNSFENNRREVQNKLYDENRDNELHFSTQSPIERNDEITDCGLCCEHSDYICEKCHYPICNSCISHLKHSTNSCPSCRCCPVVLRKIEGGDEFKESQPKPTISNNSNNNSTTTTNSTNSTNNSNSTINLTNSNDIVNYLNEISVFEIPEFGINASQPDEDPDPDSPYIEDNNNNSNNDNHLVDDEEEDPDAEEIDVIHEGDEFDADEYDVIHEFDEEEDPDA